ncbi:unnamed protein product [Coregonus sp. 'balchen']|nr:unnamed protein product [Coregonus sp. 'balchen']
MAEDISEAEDTLIYCLTGLNTMGRILLENGKKEAAGSIEDFVPNKITTLFGLMTCGANFYNSHAKVQEQVEELLQLESARVLVVSFGCREGAQLWLEQTGCKYDMLLDPQRKMGGDFVLDEGGKVILSHPCKNPMDRPEVTQMVATISSGGHPTSL